MNKTQWNFRQQLIERFIRTSFVGSGPHSDSHVSVIRASPRRKARVPSPKGHGSGTALFSLFFQPAFTVWNADACVPGPGLATLDTDMSPCRESAHLSVRGDSRGS